MQDEEALGGMRNPAKSIGRLPRTKELGSLVRELIDTCLSKYPELKQTARDILEGKEEVTQLTPDVADKLREATKKMLHADDLPEKTTVGETPLQAEVIWGWGDNSDDPDAAVLATWLRIGAPLGFDEHIKRTGVFPPSADTPLHMSEEMELMKDLDQWCNWPSAEEEAEDLHRLIREAEEKRFCRVLKDDSNTRAELQGPQVLNKLGVVVKYQGPDNKKKSRIIWDMRESGINKRCDPSERIILPRLTDAVHDALDLMREGQSPILAAIDIENAFHNIPAGSDKKYTLALTEMEDQERHFILYDVLVFGSKSSPTVWGRYAALLGRVLSAIVPEARTQVYVDDPLITLPNRGGEGVDALTRVLLCTHIFGYPLKLSKAAAGQSVKWIGATLNVDNENQKVVVTIPEDKVSKLINECKTMLGSPVVGVRSLRSLAGSLSFVAGLVPVMRPFLSPLWAALAKDATNDSQPKGSSSSRRVAGKLVHTKRIAACLTWVVALLEGEHGEMKRCFSPVLEDQGWEIITDACPWGIGGVLYHRKKPQRWFASHLPAELLQKFQAQAGDPAHNTLWEAIALLVAMRLWLPRTDRKLSVRIKSDNVGALRTLLKMTPPSQPMGQIAREIALDVAAGNYQITELRHVAGISNVVADALSRMWSPEPLEFPLQIGEESRDPVPDFGSRYWKAG